MRSHNMVNMNVKWRIEPTTAKQQYEKKKNAQSISMNSVYHILTKYYKKLCWRAFQIGMKNNQKLKERVKVKRKWKKLSAYREMDAVWCREKKNTFDSPYQSYLTCSSISIRSLPQCHIALPIKNEAKWKTACRKWASEREWARFTWDTTHQISWLKKTSRWYSSFYHVVNVSNKILMHKMADWLKCKVVVK